MITTYRTACIRCTSLDLLLSETWVRLPCEGFAWTYEWAQQARHEPSHAKQWVERAVETAPLLPT